MLEAMGTLRFAYEWINGSVFALSKSVRFLGKFLTDLEFTRKGQQEQLKPASGIE